MDDEHKDIPTKEYVPVSLVAKAITWGLLNWLLLGLVLLVFKKFFYG